jgi:hypothetical protein
MWGHYGSEHRGFCVGYNLYKLIDKYKLFPVIYDDDFFKIRKNHNENLLMETLFKSSDWSYEQEWRIIRISDKYEQSKEIDFESPVEIIIGCRENRHFVDNSEMNSKGTDLDLRFVETTTIKAHCKQNIEVNGMALSKDSFGLRKEIIYI